jgi:hypothetical protein
MKGEEMRYLRERGSMEDRRLQGQLQHTQKLAWTGGESYTESGAQHF